MGAGELHLFIATASMSLRNYATTNDDGVLRASPVTV